MNTAVRCIESKKKHAVGLAKEGLQKMEERAKQSIQRLVHMKTFQKEILEALVNKKRSFRRFKRQLQRLQMREVLS